MIQNTIRAATSILAVTICLWASMTSTSMAGPCPTSASVTDNYGRSTSIELTPLKQRIYTINKLEEIYRKLKEWGNPANGPMSCGYSNFYRDLKEPTASWNNMVYGWCDS